MPTLPDAPPPPPKRMKSLRVTTGAAPTAVDLGSEVEGSMSATHADGYGAGETLGSINKGWWYSLKGYVRAPMRLSFGGRADLTPGTEMHTPPRVPGQQSGDWTYLGLAPNPDVNLYATVGNSRVTANVIMSSNTLEDGGFPDLDQIGGIAQAYLTLKFPDTFGTAGGLSLTAGNFSMRYGNAGRGERSSGYYGTYLFGRTHAVGADLTADVDLSDRVELVAEAGAGAMLEVVPFNRVQLKNTFLPSQTTLLGDTFIRHAHAMVAFDDWLRVGLHYMVSWSPNDTAPVPPVHVAAEQSSITVYGGDVHIDGLPFGDGYIGYSRVTGQNLNPLAGGIQVIHGSTGSGLRTTYFFGRRDPGTSAATPTNDQGTIDTVLFQYGVRMSRLLGRSPLGRETFVNLFGMLNHVRSVAQPMKQAHTNDINIDNNRYKVGAEVDVSAIKFMEVALRFDRVTPSIDDSSATFMALSPRLIFHTNWKSKEYVIVDYTHYFLGPRTFPGSPYSTVYASDPNMVSITALLSF